MSKGVQVSLVPKRDPDFITPGVFDRGGSDYKIWPMSVWINENIFVVHRGYLNDRIYESFGPMNANEYMEHTIRNGPKEDKEAIESYLVEEVLLKE